MSHVVDLIFGRWRSQILYAGAALDVFAYLKPNQDRAASIVAEEIGVNPTILYRLLRALATIELLVENDAKEFCLTDAGAHQRIAAHRHRTLVTGAHVDCRPSGGG